MEDVKGLKNKAGEAVDAVNGAMGDINSKWSGMSNFFRGIFGGNGLEMFGNFFKNLGKGNVSGLSLAGLVTAAFLTFGRFGAEGQQAIAEIIYNRMVSDQFPDTLEGVIFAEGQFRSVSHLEEATPSQAQYDALENALEGPYVLPIEVVHFATYPVNENVWGKIGGHTFCYAS